MNLYSIILPLIGYFLVEMFSFICFKNDFSQVYWLELCVKHIKWALTLPILSKIKFVAKLNLACSLSGWFALSLFWDLGLSLNFSFIFFQTLIEISHAGKKKKKKGVDYFIRNVHGVINMILLFSRIMYRSHNGLGWKRL